MRIVCVLLLITICTFIVCRIVSAMTAYEFCQKYDLRVPHLIQEGLDSVSDLTPLENELVPIKAMEYPSVAGAEVHYINRLMWNKIQRKEFIQHFHLIGVGLYCLSNEHLKDRLKIFYVWLNDEWIVVYRQIEKPKGIPVIWGEE